MGTKLSIEATQKQRPRTVSAPREEKQPLLELALTEGGSTVGGLSQHSNVDFEEYLLSHEKGKKPKAPILISSSPARMEQQVALEGDETSAKDRPPAKKLELHTPKKESPATPLKLVRISGPPCEVYRFSSKVPCDRIQEYEHRIRSEMAQEKLLRFFKPRLKEVNGAIEVKFSRRSNGGFIWVDPRPLLQAIQRAERLMESPLDLDA